MHNAFKLNLNDFMENQWADIYQLMGVSTMSSSEQIHKSFLVKLRKLLVAVANDKSNNQLLLHQIQVLWIVHDILTDTGTRTDYDFRKLGIRGIETESTFNQPHSEEPSSTPLRIGELLQCAGLLEVAELNIACDMHKAMPEIRFGSFLVKHGFIQERDLESALLAQRLIRSGSITVAQYSVAMERATSCGIAIAEVLIELGYATQSIIDEDQDL